MSDLTKIKWCLEQKRGISLVEPNINLSKAYILKSENSLKAMRNEKGNLEWEITAAYYLIYFSFYSILMRCGIKSEIHSCSIEILKEFLMEEFGKENLKLFETARDLRNRVQYYTFKEEELKGYSLVVNSSLDFHLKCREILLKLSEDKIQKIRNLIEGLK